MSKVETEESCGKPGFGNEIVERSIDAGEGAGKRVWRLA
jgi:hypothetical protein